MHPSSETHDIPSLIRGVLADARGLLRTELQLAKSELSENVSRAAGGLVFFAIAALMALVGLTALAVAAVFGVAALGLSIGWAAFIVSIAFFALALLMALVGKSRLSSASLTPKRTINQVKSDIHAVKEMARV
mgnify:CR=1 FL=1